MIFRDFSKSIKWATIAAATIPAMVMFILLIAYFNQVRTADLKESMQEEGKAIADYVVYVSEYALISGDLSNLNDIVDSLFRNTKIHSISIMDIYNETILIRKRDDSLNKNIKLVSFHVPVYRKLSNENTFDLVEGYSSLLEQTFETNETDRIIGQVSVNLTSDKLVADEIKLIISNLFVGVIALMFSVYIGVCLSKRITKPISNIISGVNRIREGDYTSRINYSKNNEIGELAENIDSLSFELDSAKRDIDNHLKALTHARENSDHLVDKRTEELKIARDKAYEASKAKSEFVANVSHEIRTPLQAIVSYASFLRDNYKKGDKDRDYSQRVLTSAVHVKNLINQILDLSKIEAGKLPINIEEFNLDEVINSSITTVTPQIDDHHNKLYINSEITHPTIIKSDRIKIHEILTNLLSNAAKYTEYGSIYLKVEFFNIDYLRIEVKDTGIGIPHDKINSVFETFVRIDTKYIKPTTGTGLGLTITQQLCTLLNGEISVVSQENKGATFTVTIPVTQLDKASDKHIESQLDDIDIAGCRILIAEDDEIIQDVLEITLTQQKCNLDICSNGLDAVEMLKNNTYDLAIFDFKMPELSGQDVITAYKQNKNYQKNMPIIILSAEISDETKKDMVADGVIVLKKPILPDDLVREIHNSLADSTLKYITT